MVQCLGLCASTTADTSSISGWGARILHVAWCSQNKNKINEYHISVLSLDPRIAKMYSCHVSPAPPFFCINPQISPAGHCSQHTQQIDESAPLRNIKISVFFFAVSILISHNLAFKIIFYINFNTIE